MKSTEATVFDRKSGGTEGSAVRPGSRTKVSVPLVLPQEFEEKHPRQVGAYEGSPTIAFLIDQQAPSAPRYNVARK
jgi:hypothetical protein